MTNTDLCRDSLEGLSVGDALGAQFFVPPGAIVGGIVATFTGIGPGGIPQEWRRRRELLPSSILAETPRGRAL